MPSTFGNALRVTVFGQSHSQAVGCVVEGLPSGHVVDMEALGRFMARRAPGQGPWTTPRKEADLPRIVSGLNPRGATCGAPLAIVIENTNTRSRDYDNLMAVPRPGHADYTAWTKWHGNQDVPGGGHFSGRLTAPLCAAGGIALQMLAERGVRVGAHLLSVAD
ncbi:MAG: chorismate synthase, partial [Parafannyhessea umbonata]|nr:chorismate synthase [Parafannyhessea umbonata]